MKFSCIQLISAAVFISITAGADESRIVLPEQQGYSQDQVAGNPNAVNYYYRQVSSSAALSYFGICRLNARGDLLHVLLLGEKKGFTDGVLYIIRQTDKLPSITEVADITIKKGNFNDVLLETNGGMESYRKMAAYYQLAMFNPLLVLAKNNQPRPLLDEKTGKIIACRQPD